MNVGYSCPEIIDAVHAQMQRLPFYPRFSIPRPSPPSCSRRKLAALAPKRLNHTIFSNSGSEANETALKLIRGYHKLRGQPARRRSSRANLATTA